MMHSASEATPLRRVVMASLIGTTIEWYDFFLYGSAAALVFNKLFFPEFDPLTGTLLAFATYALGFVARPIITRLSISSRLRPMRSPKWPNTMPPTGRATNPSA